MSILFIQQTNNNNNNNNNNDNNNQSLTSDKSSNIAMTTPIQSDNDEKNSQLLESNSLRNTLTEVRDSKVISKNTNINFNQKIMCPNFTLPSCCYTKHPRACCPGISIISALFIPAILLPIVDYIAYEIDSDIATSKHHIMMAGTAFVSTAISLIILYNIIDIGFKSKGKTLAAMTLRVTFTPIMIYVLDILLNINDNNYDKKPDWPLWVMTSAITLMNTCTTVVPHHKKFKLFPRIEQSIVDGKTHYQAVSESHSLSDFKRMQEKEKTKRHHDEQVTKRHAKDAEEATKRKWMELFNNGKINYDQLEYQLKKIDPD